jgi:hypothetical protein
LLIVAFTVEMVRDSLQRPTSGETSGLRKAQV